MPWSVAAAAITVAGGAYQSKQAQEAADEQAARQSQGIGLTQQQFETVRDDLRPYRDIGNAAARRLYSVNALGGGTPDFSSFHESPDYQFRLAEGNKALERSAAARGMTLSGAQLKDLTRFGQGLASTEFGNWYNRLSNLANLGQNAAVQTGQFGANAANAMSGLYSGLGAIEARGILNRTNAVTNALGGVADIMGEYAENRRNNRRSGY